MRKYDLAVILKPETKAEEREKIVDKIKKMVEDSGGKVEKVDEWGKKEFAYPLRKLKEGYYLVFSFSCEPAKVIEIQKKLKLEEEVIRNLLVLSEEGR